MSNERQTLYDATDGPGCMWFVTALFCGIGLFVLIASAKAGHPFAGLLIGVPLMLFGALIPILARGR